MVQQVIPHTITKAVKNRIKVIVIIQNFEVKMPIIQL